MIKDVAIEQVVKERIKPCPECGQPKTDEAVDMVMETSWWRSPGENLRRG